MRLTESVYLVGGGWLGYGLSDRYDSHVYLVRSGDVTFLVDAGAGRYPERIVANIVAEGIDPATVSYILLTHAHADHAAGAAGLAALLGARVCALPEVAALVSAGDEVASGLDSARRSGTYPPELRFAPVPTHALAPGELSVAFGERPVSEWPVSERPGSELSVGEWPVGELPARVLATPGHAAGHLCLLVEDAGRRVAFTGDLVFSRGRVALLGTPDTDLVALRDSIAAVHRARPDVLLPGHGSVVLSDATEHLAVAVDRFALGQLPPALLP